MTAGGYFAHDFRPSLGHVGKSAGYNGSIPDFGRSEAGPA